MYKILIVDDEKDVVRLLKDYFQLKGYDTITAYSGVEAMEKVSLKPDVILLDINMPGMEGTEVCRNIRDYVSCPILFLTAKIEDSDKIKGFAVGGARVSEKHAGFCVNCGGTAADFLALMAHVQKTVYETKGIMLEPEVRILGEDAPVKAV